MASAEFLEKDIQINSTCKSKLKKKACGTTADGLMLLRVIKFIKPR